MAEVGVPGILPEELEVVVAEVEEKIIILVMLLLGQMVLVEEAGVYQTPDL
jgi:hypothetical protein